MTTQQYNFIMTGISMILAKQMEPDILAYVVLGIGICFFTIGLLTKDK